jgi:hypothetical protein
MIRYDERHAVIGMLPMTCFECALPLTRLYSAYTSRSKAACLSFFVKKFQAWSVTDEGLFDLVQSCTQLRFLAITGRGKTGLLTGVTIHGLQRMFYRGRSHLRIVNFQRCRMPTIDADDLLALVDILPPQCSLKLSATGWTSRSSSTARESLMNRKIVMGGVKGDPLTVTIRT